LKPVAKLGNEDGYTFDEKTKVLRIHHTSPNVDIQGQSDEPVIEKVDFDTPHLGAGVPLRGEYPSGVINWGDGVWRTVKPGGMLSTFGVGTADPKATSATFRFSYPKVLVQFEVSNPTDHVVTLTLNAPEMQNVSFQLKPGQLQRIRTGWQNRASQVTFESPELGALRFDNLGYSLALWTNLDWAL
jgi:hypothetical protein